MPADKTVAATTFSAPPPAPLPLMETLQLQLTRQGVDRDQSPRITVRPSPDRSPPAPARPAWEHLPNIEVDQPNSDLRVQQLLGQGGMGQVQSAHQRSLNREVALKTLLPGKRSGMVIQALLREAELVGQLDHPNIIPVHALGRDPHLGPLMVMKRVEGTSWEQLLAQKQPGELDQHLDILMSVCNAVAFAHSRGILHRDIKPSNVMVGSFGQVYLLDWGVALPLHRRDQEPNDAVAGSPAYMAPEMLHGPRLVDERTDVFLLGATLHEVLTGQTRHTPSSLFDCMMQLMRLQPFAYGPEIPAGLAAICNKACAPLPEDRYGSVTELQEAIVEYRARRASRAITQTAQAHLEALERELRHQDSDPVTRQRLFESSRAGFRDALASWPENEPALQGLERLHRAMVRQHLEAGNAVGARALLEEAGIREEALLRDLEALEEKLQAQAQAQQELDSMRSELRMFGQNWGRSISAVFSAFLWLGLLLGTSWGQQRGYLPTDRLSGVYFSLMWLVVLALMRWALRAPLAENRIFGQFMTLATLMPIMVLCNHLLTFVDGRTLEQAIPINFLLVAFTAGVSALFLERSLLAHCVLLVLAGFAGAWWPQHALTLAAALAFTSNLWFGWLMRPTRSQSPSPAQEA